MFPLLDKLRFIEDRKKKKKFQKKILKQITIIIIIQETLKQFLKLILIK